ncbi:MAG: hypothetical protein AB7H88_07785 [Vicinamibacterales bacterium]
MLPPTSFEVRSMSGASAVTVTSSVRPPTASVMFTDWVWPTSTRTSRVVNFLKPVNSAEISYCPGRTPLKK